MSKVSRIEIFHNLSSHYDIIPVEPAKRIAKTQFHIKKAVKTYCQRYYKPTLICNACSTGECNQPHLLYCQKIIEGNE